MQYIIATKWGANCPLDWKLRVGAIPGIKPTTQSANMMFVEATTEAIEELQIQLGQYLRIEPPIPHHPN